VETPKPSARRLSVARRVSRPVGRPAPLLYLGGIAAGWLLQQLRPLPSRFVAAWRLARCLLIAGGFTVGLSGFSSAAAADERPGRIGHTAAVVSTGIFRYIPQPDVPGFCHRADGCALLINSAWALLLVVPAMLVTTGIIAREEMYMERRFRRATSPGLQGIGPTVDLAEPSGPTSGWRRHQAQDEGRDVGVFGAWRSNRFRSVQALPLVDDVTPASAQTPPSASRRRSPGIAAADAAGAARDPRLQVVVAGSR